MNIFNMINNQVIFVSRKHTETPQSSFLNLQFDFTYIDRHENLTKSSEFIFVGGYN